MTRPQHSTLFPYTTLFRSICHWRGLASVEGRHKRRYNDLLNSFIVYDDVVSSGLAHSQHLVARSEEHTSELQSQFHLVCRLLLEKKKRLPTTTILPSGCRA